jgi:hypothetical protein
LPAKNEKLAIPNPGLEKVVQFCLTFPSGLLARVEKLEADKAAVREILEVLGVKGK